MLCGPRLVSRAIHYWTIVIKPENVITMRDDKKGKVLIVKEHYGTYYCAASTLEEYLTSIFKVSTNYEDYCPWLMPNEPRPMDPKDKGMLDMSEEAVLDLPDGLREIAQEKRAEWAKRQRGVVRHNWAVADIRRFLETGDALGLAVMLYNNSDIFPFEATIEYLQDFTGRIHSGDYG